MDYVHSAIRSVLCLNFKDLEVVVEDNSDTNQLEQWIETNVADSRLVYHYCSEPTSQAGNYNRAMLKVRGEYVASIGDDDGVGMEIIDAAQWAKAHDLDALTPSSVVNYSWPDLKIDNLNAVGPGELRIQPFSSAVSFPDPQEEAIKCMQDFGQNFHKLPKAYFGIVRKSCMDRVKDKTGTYFPGVSPDMASAMALACIVKKTCYVDYPLFVPGSSAKSNAGVSGMRKHIGSLRDQSHLPPDCESKWSSIVPKFYSVHTIWAETAVAL